MTRWFAPDAASALVRRKRFGQGLTTVDDSGWTSEGEDPGDMHTAFTAMRAIT